MRSERSSAMIPENVLERISEITGLVHTDNTTLKSHGSDWTRFYEPNPSAVLFPKTTQEVSEKFSTQYDRY